MPFLAAELEYMPNMPFADDHCFIRPNCPKWHDRHEVFILNNQSIFLVQLEFNIIAQQAPSLFFKVLFLLSGLFFNFQGQRCLAPDLPMRMRITATHDLAFVLEDLY